MKKLLMFILLIISYVNTKAQYFLPPFDRFSSSKPAYITLTDGTKLEGTIFDIDRKKGLIEEITLKMADKSKRKLLPENIKEMYLPATGWDQFVEMENAIYDIRTYAGEIDMDHINDGYGYFVSTNVMIKSKELRLLMQVINPAFSSKIKVYHDPYASETISAGYAGMTMVGGDDKSYYIELNGKPAYKLKKKDFDETFAEIFSTCPDFVKKYKDDPKWARFDNYIYECTTGVDPKTLKKKKK